MGFRKALIDEYLKAKSDYMTAHHGQKGELRQQIEKARADIASWSHRDEKGFDWPIEFAEVFVGSGFDVVLANPPYVRQELIKEIKPRLAKVYPAIYSGTADLYCYFYARGSSYSERAACSSSYRRTNGCGRITARSSVHYLASQAFRLQYHRFR